MTDYIKFTDYHVADILNGDKWMTVRYGWDEDELPTPGESVDLVDGGEDKFAEGFITIVTSLTIEEFVEADFDGHEKYEDAGEMCSMMQQFYKEEELTPDTEVDLVCFTVENELLDLEKNP